MNESKWTFLTLTLFKGSSNKQEPPLFQMTLESCEHSSSLKVFHICVFETLYHSSNVSVFTLIEQKSSGNNTIEWCHLSHLDLPAFWPHPAFVFFFGSRVAPCSTGEIEQSKSVTGRAERAERRVGLKVRQKAERQTEGENEDRPRRLWNISHNISFFPSDPWSEVQPRADRLTLYFSSALPPWTSD